MAGLATLSTSNKEERASALVQESLRCASNCLKLKNYGRAYAHFLLVLQLKPDLKQTSLKEDFVLSLKEWTEHLERLGRIEDLFKCYDQTCDIFPECDVAMNNIGAQLFRLGYIDEAAAFVRRALKLSPTYLAAKENLENICCHLVERWHFRMLNDMTRNRAFRDAIDMAIARGYQHVLDIGAGTGLLSLFATEAGAASVFACEQSKTMFTVAQEVLESNGAMFRVCLLPKMSTELVIPQDIPTRVTLVTTETFDAGLFGEHIVSTLHHAWQSLLTTETDAGFQGKVIPRGATVYLCAIECETIRKQNRLLYPVLMNIDMTGIFVMCRTSVDHKEPYTTEDLSAVRSGYTQLSEPKPVLVVNFDDPLEVEKLHSGVKLKLELEIINSGELDAIAMWFDLHLDDSITITTAPDTVNCWEQAIFPMQPVHFACKYERENLAVKRGDSLKVDLSLIDDCLRVSGSNIKRGNKICVSSSEEVKGETSMQVYSGDLQHKIENISVTHSHVNSEKEPHLEAVTAACVSKQSHRFANMEHVHALSSSDIARLNDMTFHKAFHQGLETHLHRCQSGSLTMLDLCSGLSTLGLQAMLLGYSDITVVTNHDHIRDLLVDIAEVNSVDRRCLNFTTSQGVLESDTEFDVIVCDLVEPSGVFRQQVLEDLALLRLTSLSPSGIILPHKLTAVGICIESEQLLKTSRVMNKATLGFNIAEFMKEFQATTHLDIDLHTLQYTKLSEPFELFQLELNEAFSDLQLPAFLHKEKEVIVECIDSGQFDAIVYWFEMQVLDDIKLLTVNPCLHWKQAAKMLGESESVEAGQNVTLSVMLKNSYIDIKCVTDKE